MDKAIKKLLYQRAQKHKRPNGEPYFRLLAKDESVIAKAFEITPKDVQIIALQNEIIPERYCRNQNSISSGEQIRLLQSHVTVIGQGGLGGTVTEILSRIGIGKLTLVDNDVFEESNLNRQLLCTTKNLGKKKVLAGKTRVMAINPAIEVLALSKRVTKKNVNRIIKEADLVIDCLDSITSRFILEKACQEEQTILISAAIGGSSGQATVIFPGDGGLKFIYTAQSKETEKGIEKDLGTLAYAAMLMAAIECAEVVCLLCKKHSSLRNSLLIAEMDNTSFEKVALTTGN